MILAGFHSSFYCNKKFYDKLVLFFMQLYTCNLKTRIISTHLFLINCFVLKIFFRKIINNNKINIYIYLLNTLGYKF